MESEAFKYARLMIAQVKEVRSERKHLSDLFNHRIIEWQRVVKDHNLMCHSEADLIRRGETPEALGKFNSIIECTCQIQKRAIEELEGVEEELVQKKVVEGEAIAKAMAAFNAVPRSSCIEYAELQAEIAAFI